MSSACTMRSTSTRWARPFRDNRGRGYRDTLLERTTRNQAQFGAWYDGFIGKFFAEAQTLGKVNDLSIGSRGW